MLPLAVSASAVLLLGSASIHTLSLQRRLRLQASNQHQQVADQMRSAAQAFAAASYGPESCLLLWPSTRWTGAALDCLASDPSKLSGGVVGEMSWVLLDWLPSTEGGQLKLELANGRRGKFRIALDPVSPVVRGISDVQLQARVPQFEGE